MGGYIVIHQDLGARWRQPAPEPEARHCWSRCLLKEGMGREEGLGVPQGRVLWDGWARLFWDELNQQLMLEGRK